MPITDNERTIIEAATLDAAWPLVETFSRTPRWKPDDVNAGAGVIAAALAAAGIPVDVHEPELYLSIPHSATVRVGDRSFLAKAPSSSRPAPGGLAGPLVRLDANPAALRSYSRDIRELFRGGIASMEALRAQVAGRIVLMGGFGNPALTSLVTEAGAIGLIAVNPGVDRHWGTCTTIWGNPGLADLATRPAIPVVAVSHPDGEAIAALAAGGDSVELATVLQEGWFTQRVPVVTIPAADNNPEFVLVHGHYDSWDVGVGDNATGDAALLEMARVLWAKRALLRRGVRIAWWPGHSTGRYAGSTWFSDHFALELDAHCVAQINCDSPGCRWATSYHDTRAFSESAGLAAQAIRDVVPDADISIKRPPQAGDYSFNNIGLTSLFMLSSTMPEALRREKTYYEVSGCGANIAWHTENDTIEIADRDVLLTDIRIYLLAIFRIATSDVLPFDWTATIEEFEATITDYEKASGGAADLGDCRAALAGLGAALATLHAPGRDSGIVNDVQRRLARILVPLNYTRRPRFLHDAAVTVPPLPSLAVAADLGRLEGDARRSAAVDLLRGRNLFIAAIRDAESLVRSAGG